MAAVTFGFLENIQNEELFVIPFPFIQMLYMCVSVCVIDAFYSIIKMNRGLSVIKVQRSFVKREGRELSDTDYCRAAVLG